MGVCIEYVYCVGVFLFLYVFSDGLVVSNGMIDDFMDGCGKGVWIGDNLLIVAFFFWYIICLVVWV